MPAGCLLTLAGGSRREHKLTTEERDSFCVFLRPGIQFSFRGCVFCNGSSNTKQNISCCSCFLTASSPPRGRAESQKPENARDAFAHVRPVPAAPSSFFPQSVLYGFSLLVSLRISLSMSPGEYFFSLAMEGFMGKCSYYFFSTRYS